MDFSIKNSILEKNFLDRCMSDKPVCSSVLIFSGIQLIKVTKRKQEIFASVNNKAGTKWSSVSSSLGIAYNM